MLKLTYVFYLVAAAGLITGTCHSKGLQTDHAAKDYVVLLHGLGRTSRSMKPLEKYLFRHGFRVVNIGYPSTKYPIEKLSEIIPAEIRRQCTDKAKRIHFVTHSFGGIILRHFQKKSLLPRTGRVVMLSPPNQGSEVVDTLKKYSLFSMIMGPSSLQLGTDPDSVPNTLGPVNFELGIITGNTSLNPIFSHIIPGDDDGKVSVQRAKVDGMADFLVVPHSHSFIMANEGVAKQVAYFIQHGKFNKMSLR